MSHLSPSPVFSTGPGLWTTNVCWRASYINELWKDHSGRWVHKEAWSDRMKLSGNRMRGIHLSVESCGYLGFFKASSPWSSQNCSTHRSKVLPFQMKSTNVWLWFTGWDLETTYQMLLFFPFSLEKPRKRCQRRWCKNGADSEIPNPLRNFPKKRIIHPINSHLEVPGGELFTLRPLRSPRDYGYKEANPDCHLLQCKSFWLLEKLKIQETEWQDLRGKEGWEQGNVN